MESLSEPARRRSLLALSAMLLGGCALFGGSEPLRVSVVDLQSLPAPGFETRVLVKLRIQNPTKKALPFQGVSLELDLQGMQVASGVSATAGRLPPFGELLIEVPVTVGSMSVLRQALSPTGGPSTPRLRVTCTARGRLVGRTLDSESFESRGEVEWPPRPAPPQVPA